MKEIEKLIALRQIEQGELSLGAASFQLGMSYRQIQRIWKRFCKQGQSGLVHGNCGKPSNNSYSAQFKASILEKYRQLEVGLSPSQFSELLNEQGVSVDHETCRRWLIESKYWQPKSRKAKQPAL